MRPAWSIIFFTTISGLGFGLAAWLVLGFVNFANPAELLVVGLAVVALIGAGLLASAWLILITLSLQVLLRDRLLPVETPDPS